MKKIKFIIFAILTLLLIAALTCCTDVNKKNRTEDIIIGKKYVKQIVWDKNDPFEKKIIDTVIVLAKKNGYVKYYFVNHQKNDTTFFLSCREEYFLKQLQNK